MDRETTLNYIATKFELDITRKPPIEILNINRPIMAQTLHELGFKEGAEIGTAQGDHAKTLCENIPGIKLHCIDIWTPYDGYNEYVNRIVLYHNQAVEKLKPYNVNFIQKYSVEASKDFEDQSLDFVYIDANHDFLHVAEDLTYWIPKVKPGGIIFGHDYQRSRNPNFHVHVQDVVGAWTYSHNVRPWFILGTYGRRDGMYREGTRSWMWVV